MDPVSRISQPVISSAFACQRSPGAAQHCRPLVVGRSGPGPLGVLRPRRPPDGRRRQWRAPSWRAVRRSTVTRRGRARPNRRPSRSSRSCFARWCRQAGARGPPCSCSRCHQGSVFRREGKRCGTAVSGPSAIEALATRLRYPGRRPECLLPSASCLSAGSARRCRGGPRQLLGTGRSEPPEHAPGLTSSTVIAWVAASWPMVARPISRPSSGLILRSSQSSRQARLFEDPTRQPRRHPADGSCGIAVDLGGLHRRGTSHTVRCSPNPGPSRGVVVAASAHAAIRSVAPMSAGAHAGLDAAALKGHPRTREECLMAKNWRCLIGRHDWRTVETPDRDKYAECTRCGKHDWTRLIPRITSKWRGGSTPPGGDLGY